MLAFGDLGLGNGLLNAVAAASARDDRQTLRRTVSTAFFLLLAIAALAVFAFTLAYSHLDWATLFNSKSAAAMAEAGPTCAVLFFCFALSLPLGTVQRVQLGFQEGFRSNIWQIAGSIVAFAALIVAISLRSGLPWLVAAVSSAPVLLLTANWVAQFRWARPWLMPSWRLFDPPTARSLMHRGSLFFCSQVGAALVTQAPTLMIAHILGPASVPEYGVALKVITLVLLLNSMLLSPLWPAYADAYAASDMSWVRRTFVRTLRSSLAVSFVGSALFFATYRQIIPTWVSSEVMPTVLTAASLSAFAVFNSVRYAASMCLNGCNRLVGQAVYQLPAAIGGALIANALSRKHGVGGIALGFTAAEFLVALCQLVEIRLFFTAFDKPNTQTK
jgi:O-antigen/teichoic acid export membrane protein